VLVCCVLWCLVCGVFVCACACEVACVCVCVSPPPCNSRDGSMLKCMCVCVFECVCVCVHLCLFVCASVFECVFVECLRLCVCVRFWGWGVITYHASFSVYV